MSVLNISVFFSTQRFAGIQQGVFQLRHKLFTFFKEKNHECKDDLKNDEFISRLAYLSDILQALNLKNLSFQGSNSNIAVFISKLEAFIRKLDVGIKKVKSKQFGMFRLLTTLSVEPNDKLSQEIEDHLKLLRADYFPDVLRCSYTVNTFRTDPALLPVGTGEQEEISDTQVDDTAKAKQKQRSPINFWLIMSSTYPTLARNIFHQLLVFPSTREYEQGISTLMTIKSNSQNRLIEPGHYFRCAVSKVMPRIDQFVQKKRLLCFGVMV